MSTSLVMPKTKAFCSSLIRGNSGYCELPDTIDWQEHGLPPGNIHLEQLSWYYCRDYKVSAVWLQ